MDIENQEEVIETPEVEVDAPEVESSEVEAEEAPQVDVDAEPLAAAEYKPNFEYKANGERKEMDEFWRGVIKDKESEDKVRSILTAADAFESYKASVAPQLDHYKQLEAEYSAPIEALQRVAQLYNAGEHKQALQELGYSNEMLLQQMDDQTLFNESRKRLEFKNLPEEQKALYNRQRESESEKLRLQRDYEARQAEMTSMQEASVYQLANSTRELMQVALSQPEVSSVAQRYDAANGEGSFFEEVRQAGEALTNQRGEWVSPNEAVSFVMRRYQPFLQGQVTQAGGAMASSSNQVVAERKASIPNVKSSGGSPAKKGVTSMEDIKRIRQQMASAE